MPLISSDISFSDALLLKSSKSVYSPFGMIKAIGNVAKKLGVSEVSKGGGYRSLVNVGENGGQEVPHLHFHIFGGENVGKMVSS